MGAFTIGCVKTSMKIAAPAMQGFTTFTMVVPAGVASVAPGWDGSYNAHECQPNFPGIACLPSRACGRSPASAGVNAFHPRTWMPGPHFAGGALAAMSGPPDL